MKDEVYYCDICHCEFNSIDDLYYSFTLSDGVDIFEAPEVCKFCFGSIESILQRIKLNNYGNNKKNKV